MNILDYVFPKRCVSCRSLGSYICSTCFSYISFVERGICFVCQKSAIGGVTHPLCKKKYTIDGVSSSIVYAGVVKRLIYQFKFSPYVSDIQSVLVELFYEGLIQNEAFVRNLEFKNDGVAFVPVPLHSSKLRKRGYNQADLLAKGIASRLVSEVGSNSDRTFRNDIVIWDCLERVRSTHTQVGLTAEKRKENIKDAFRVKSEFQEKLQKNVQVFLIDDIVTSGATLLEAGSVLKKAGVKYVWGATLAHGA